MIELTDVSKTYGGKVKALDRVSLRVDSGCIYGFLGPNGAGKTTAIKLITGILQPDGGQIRVDGVDIAKDPIGAKGKIGFVPDDPNVFYASRVWNISRSWRISMAWGGSARTGSRSSQTASK